MRRDEPELDILSPELRFFGLRNAVLQLHLTFGGDIVGVNSDNELYGASDSSSLSFQTLQAALRLTVQARLYNEIQPRLTSGHYP